MPGSTISLDTLSSPSPSPSPPPETNKPSEITSAGLDSDSELSELTEEEQEAEKQDEDEDTNNDDSPDPGDRRGPRPSRRGGRKKRSSIVPAPMWGWAEAKTSNVVEEEEEEEMAGPPRAMEEEEDEEEEEGSVGPFPSVGRRQNFADDEGDDHPEDEEPEQTHAIDPADEEESLSEDDGSPTRGRRVRRSARVLHPRDDLDSNSSEDEVDDLRKGEEEQEDDDEDDDMSAPSRGQAVESENETEFEDEDSKEHDTAGLEASSHTTTSVFTSMKTMSNAMLTSLDVDVTAPSPQAVAPLAAAAAASSIMAGSTVLNAPSPSPSPSPSASGSANSSRSPSPPLPASIKPSDLSEPNGVARQKRELKQKPNLIDKDTKTPLSPIKDISNAADADIDITEHDQDRDHSAEINEADEPSPDDDLEIELESDLQPAHRAEALDVLAAIELKFALLREKVYVEKMEGLAWEETLVSEGTHPELLHLHKELSKRRDKRIELATRKRAYEIANVTKRRRVDEDATWSWWKLARDELQMDMISEANRTKRRLERERRAAERPQPVRRIPDTPREVPVPPTLRKIIKSLRFSHRRHNKPDNSGGPSVPLLYPELSTLSSSDVNGDLEFLYQHRRTSYDAHRIGGVNIINPSFGAAPQPHGYDPYNDNIGMPPSFGLQPLPPPTFQHHAPPPLPPTGPGKSLPAFPPYGPAVAPGPGPGRVHHQPAQAPPPPLHNHPHHGMSQFVVDHDMGAGAGPILSHQSYFGSQPTAAGVTYTGRRSISPVNVMPNGSGAKHNGTWIGPGVGMGAFHGSSKASEWMVESRKGEINVNEDDERERGREKDRREKERDREHLEQERERQRENYHMQQLMQQQHRHPLPPQHQHIHNVSPEQAPHHHGVTPHHHHRPPHHHHVLHHHHGQGGAAVGHASSSLPPGGPSLSPRTSREFDGSRPHSGLAQHPTEVINLSSSKHAMPSHWKGDDQQGSSSTDYRDSRNKHSSRPASGPPLEERERPLAMPFVMTSTHAMQPSNISPPASAPPNGRSSPRGSWNTPEDNSYRIPPPSSGYLGSHEGHGHSPGHRYTNSSTGVLGRGPPPLQPPRQSSLGHSPPRPRPLPPPSPSSSSNTYPNPVRSPARFGPPVRPPRSRSPSVNLKLHRPNSPGALSMKMMNGPAAGSSSVYPPHLSGPGRTATPTGLGPAADIKGSGPSTTASAYTVGNRTTSPVMTFASPSSHANVPPAHSSRSSLTSNGSDRDRDRHLSPRVSVLSTPAKMVVPQMVDGH